MNKKTFVQLISTLLPTSKILYYDGSFDPFHLGHLSALKKCTETFNPDIVFILAHEKNKFKPNLIDFKHRLQMILLTIGDLPYSLRKIVHVLDTPGENHAIKSELKQKFAHLALLMGTDSLKFFNFDRHSGVSQFFISVRKDENIDPSLMTKVTPFIPQITDCSSTKIRNLLKEVYWGKHNTQELSKLLTHNAINYVIANQLYRPSFSDLIGHIILELEQDFQTKEIVALFTLQTPSENYCFKIGDLFVKCFTKESHINECHFEFMGMKFLSNLKISFKPSSLAPKYKHLFRFSYLCVNLIPTPDLSSLFLNCDNESKYENLCICFQTIGKALAELHLSQPLQVVEDALEFHFNKIEAKLQLLNLGVDQWTKYHELKRLYIGNPGYHTITHGDPNLGNFILDGDHTDHTDHTVYLLDLDRLYHCHKLCGNRGLPADDFFRFIASVRWAKGKNSYFSDDERIQKLIEIFSQSYHSTLGIDLKLTLESLNFYSYYWSLRDQ